MSRRPTPADDSRSSSADRSTAEPFGTLLARVGTGDRAAFSAVYDRIAPTLLRLGSSRGLPAGETEDVVERVMIRLWQTAPRFARDRGGASDWMLAIVDEALRDHGRPAAGR